MADGRAVVIQTAHLGDAVLTLPLLHALAARHGPVAVVTTPAAAPLLAGQPPVAEVLSFDKQGANGGALGLLRMAGRLRALSARTAWLPHRSMRSALLARLAGIPERIGFEGSPGRWWYTRQVPLPAAGHQVARLVALAAAEAVAAPWYRVPPEAATRAASWRTHQRLGPAYIVLAPGSRWGTKRWPYFADLAAALPLPVVVIGGPEEVALAAEVAAQGPAGSVSGAGALDLPAVAAVIAEAALVVSNDSVALHLAGALARPAVALFGPTVPAFGFGPLGADDPVVQLDGLPCRPCSAHGPMTCPLGHHRCLRDLPVATVLAAVRARLAAAGAPGRQ